MERRLAAIFAADMVGFSRLVEADEVGTLARQKIHRAELIDPRIEAHGGRIIKLTGDGMIAEFPSIVEAVQCAVSVQREMAAREAEVPEAQKIRYRVAVNLGDVIFDEGDVYGDGVNIAARLEALAEPGGIVISGTAYDHLKSTVDVGYEDLGEQQVKNIATPVRVYRVVPEGSAAPVRSVAPKTRRNPVYVVVIAVLLAATVAIWEFAIRPGTVDATGVDEEAVLTMPSGPIIAVLPFENRSGDPSQDYFSQGISLEIIAELGLYTDLRVLGRAATFYLTGDARAPISIGANLGADYVLAGYIRRAGDRVRVVAELTDTQSSAQVWTETYDEDLTPQHLFDLQSEIAEKTAIAVGDPLKGIVFTDRNQIVKRKAPKQLSSYECALYSMNDWYQLSVLKRRFDCTNRVIEEEPDYALAWSVRSFIYRMDYLFGFNVTGASKDEALRLAIDSAEKSVKLEPESYFTRFNLVAIYLASQQREKFDVEVDLYFKKGWQSNLNMGWLGFFVAASGRWDFGTAVVRKAISLSPGNYPKGWHWTFAFYHFNRGEYEKSLEHLHIPAAGLWISDLYYAETYGAAGRLEDAKASVATLLEKRPGFTISDAVDYHRSFLMEDDFIERAVMGLRAAGLPAGGYDG